jgi:hypothetical protein
MYRSPFLKPIIPPIDTKKRKLCASVDIARKSVALIEKELMELRKKQDAVTDPTNRITLRADIANAEDRLLTAKRIAYP